MSCPAMRDGLRLMLEGSGKFEVAGRARGGAERTASATSSGTAAKQLRSKLGDDTDHPACTFIEPSVGYRMEKGEPKEEVG